MKSIVITGASSGIGKASAKYFASKGWKVAATMRNPRNESELNNIDHIETYALDVTKESEISRARDKIISDFGTVDVLLNNAGYGLLGPFEKARYEQIRKQFDTNVFGMMAVTRAFLPHFRENSNGLILNVSSIGGQITFPFMSLYHSTKWAIEGFSESLSYELKQFGIRVKIIEPGGVETDFGTRSLIMCDREDVTAYDELLVQFSHNFMKSITMSTAEFVAEQIYLSATDGKDRLRYLIGSDADQLYRQRLELGDDAFIVRMKGEMLG